MAVWASSRSNEGSQFHEMPGIACASADGSKVNPLRSQTKVSLGNPMSTAASTCTVMVSVQMQLFCRSCATHQMVTVLSKTISKLCVSVPPRRSNGYQLKLKFSGAASDGLA